MPVSLFGCRPGHVDRHDGTAADFLRRHCASLAQLATLSHAVLSSTLIKRIADTKMLLLAVKKVRREGGPGPGVDGRRPSDLDHRDWMCLIRDLSDEIRTGTYRPDRELTVRTENDCIACRRPVAAFALSPSRRSGIGSFNGRSWKSSRLSSSRRWRRRRTEDARGARRGTPCSPPKRTSPRATTCWWSPTSRTLSTCSRIHRCAVRSKHAGAPRPSSIWSCGSPRTAVLWASAKAALCRRSFSTST